MPHEIEIRNRAAVTSDLKFIFKTNWRRQFEEDKAFIRLHVVPWLQTLIKRRLSDEDIRATETYKHAAKIVARAWKLRARTHKDLFSTNKTGDEVFFATQVAGKTETKVLSGTPIFVHDRVYIIHQNYEQTGWVLSELSSGARVPTIPPQKSKNAVKILARKDRYLKLRIMVMVALICSPFLNKPLVD